MQEFTLFEDWTFFDVMRQIILWSTPVVFLVGITMLVYNNYRNLEKFLSREFGMRKRLIPKIEQNIYTFHEWCLRKQTIIGLCCVIYSVAVFFILRKVSSLGEVLGDPY
jgi:hypothetical protein